MNSLAALVEQNVALLVSLLAFGVAIALFLAFRERLGYAWMDLRYGIAFIGKLARLSRNTTRAANSGWLQSERTLCADYAKYVAVTSKEQFLQALQYLNKAQDLGRKPLPAWMLVVLVILLIAEGLGFASLVSDVMSREGSQNQHLILTFAISLVMCIIMIIVTHEAGQQLHRTGLIRRCDKEWRDRGQSGDFSTVSVKLQDEQSRDDGAPGFTQTINRVGSNGSYAMVVVAVIAIIAIAVGSTAMRIKNLNGRLYEETTVPAAAMLFSSDNPAPAAAPAELAGPQKNADDKAKAEALADEKEEAWFAFVILGVVFVVTQIVGIYTGIKYGFSAKESPAAYNQTLGFATYSAYLDHVEPIIHRAQARLDELQRRLAANPGNVRLYLDKKFNDYLAERYSQRAQREAPEPQALQASNASTATTFEDALQKLSTLNVSQEKKTFVISLPNELRARVVAHLKETKAREEAARNKALDTDLEGLF